MSGAVHYETAVGTRCGTTGATAINGSKVTCKRCLKLIAKDNEKPTDHDALQKDIDQLKDKGLAQCECGDWHPEYDIVELNGEQLCPDCIKTRSASHSKTPTGGSPPALGTRRICGYCEQRHSPVWCRGCKHPPQRKYPTKYRGQKLPGKTAEELAEIIYRGEMRKPAPETGEVK